MQQPAPRRLRRRAITATAERILGTPVGVAIPVQRQPPSRMLTAAGLELASFAVVALTSSLVAVAVMVVCTAALLALAATNRKRVLAVTRSEVVVMAADNRGRPLAATGPATAVTFPEPRGVGVPVQLEDGRWWIDRNHYARLRRARELSAAAGW